ncbi:MAG TPA: type II toxin-antitoxin system Phd/YefM family antitoxin [Gaiellaceae bacterium]|nr:type II toxin-antitoxin system Phd/YefM family antitoxin [Gaiellaceae bacterium]
MVKTVVVGIHQAKTNFSRLVKRVERGEEVIVQNFGRPVAKLVPYTSPQTARKPGLLAGRITIKPDFDELPPGFEELVP